MGTVRRDGQFDLATVETATTLRDRLQEVPVDAIVPDGWRVGVEVVKFGDEHPADGAILTHPNFSRGVLVTDAGTDGDFLAVYERDRTVGTRTPVAHVPGFEADREAVREAIEAAARHATTIESGAPTDATVASDAPHRSLGETVRRALKVIRFE